MVKATQLAKEFAKALEETLGNSDTVYGGIAITQERGGAEGGATWANGLRHGAK